MNLHSHFGTLASYNVWATQRLFNHIDALPEADYRRDAGLFFKSVHGTLNHLLLGEHLVWFQRFAHGQSPSVPLDTEVETDRVRLRDALTVGAAAWHDFIRDCPSDRWTSPLHFRRINGAPTSLPFAPTLMHVFNHGTHHRGQITAAITAMGYPCPEIDLVLMLVEESTQATP
jgi:uncharacterized damage-inducible protein DinB